MQIATLLKGKHRSAIVLPTEAVLDLAIERMHNADASAVMIVENGRVQGILTRGDVIRCLARSSGVQTDRIAVKEIMSPDPVFAGPDEMVHAVLASMQADGIGHLPVMDRGRLAGLLRIADLLDHQNRLQQQEIAHLQEYIHNMQNAEYD